MSYLIHPDLALSSMFVDDAIYKTQPAFVKCYSTWKDSVPFLLIQPIDLPSY
jgi:hypothetical protein